MNIKHVLLVLFEICIHFGNSNGLEGESIRGGIEAPIRRYPYQVSIQRHGTHICGGGTINVLYAVTAAHCIIDSTTGSIVGGPINVVGGVDDLKLESSMRYTVRVSKIYIPYEYAISYHVDKSGDIAVLRLDTTVNDIADPNIQYLRLPINPEGFYGKTAVVTGFGSSYLKSILDLDFNSVVETIDKPDGKLYSADARILTDEECSRQKIYAVSKSRFCAKLVVSGGDDEIGICYGDSGSPLVLDGNTLVGIVHSGPHQCDESTEASLYTNVTTFVPFIKAVLGKDRFSGIKFTFNKDTKNWNM